MIFSANEVIGGLPAKIARDFMREHRFQEFEGIAAIMEFCGSSRAQAEAFMGFASAKGWLTPGSAQGQFVLTPIGVQAGAARIGKAISRQKADKLVADIIQRAIEWNELPECTIFVEEISVFGSYLSEAQTLGDVDLAVKIGYRPEHAELELPEVHQRALNLAESQGWAPPRDFVGLLCFFELGLKRYLKARQPAISLVDWRELAAMKPLSTSVFNAAA